MKYHWIDYFMSFPSGRLDSPFLHSKMLIMSSNERFRKQNAQLMKLQSIFFFLGIKRRYEEKFRCKGVLKQRSL